MFLPRTGCPRAGDETRRHTPAEPTAGKRNGRAARHLGGARAQLPGTRHRLAGRRETVPAERRGRPTAPAAAPPPPPTTTTTPTPTPPPQLRGDARREAGRVVDGGGHQRRSVRVESHLHVDGLRQRVAHNSGPHRHRHVRDDRRHFQRLQPGHLEAAAHLAAADRLLGRHLDVDVVVVVRRPQQEQHRRDHRHTHHDALGRVHRLADPVRQHRTDAHLDRSDARLHHRVVLDAAAHQRHGRRPL